MVHLEKLQLFCWSIYITSHISTYCFNGHVQVGVSWVSRFFIHCSQGNLWVQRIKTAYPWVVTNLSTNLVKCRVPSLPSQNPQSYIINILGRSTELNNCFSLTLAQYINGKLLASALPSNISLRNRDSYLRKIKKLELWIRYWHSSGSRSGSAMLRPVRTALAL